MKQAHHKHMIEGELVTMPEIAARLGVTETTARSRLKRSKGLPGPVTWERLGMDGRKQGAA